MRKCITSWKTVPAIFTGQRNHDAIASVQNQTKFPSGLTLCKQRVLGQDRVCPPETKSSFFSPKVEHLLGQRESPGYNRGCLKSVRPQFPSKPAGLCSSRALLQCSDLYRPGFVLERKQQVPFSPPKFLKALYSFAQF